MYNNFYIDVNMYLTYIILPRMHKEKNHKKNIKKMRLLQCHSGMLYLGTPLP